jgi:hypothetical protein
MGRVSRLLETNRQHRVCAKRRTGWRQVFDDISLEFRSEGIADAMHGTDDWRACIAIPDGTSDLLDQNDEGRVADKSVRPQCGMDLLWTRLAERGE